MNIHFLNIHLSLTLSQKPSKGCCMMKTYSQRKESLIPQSRQHAPLKQCMYLLQGISIQIQEAYSTLKPGRTLDCTGVNSIL